MDALSKTEVMVGLLTSLATVTGIARYWVDSRSLFVLLSTLSELTMAVSFSLMGVMFPAIVLASMTATRIVRRIDWRVLLLLLPFMLGVAGALGQFVDSLVWWQLLPGAAFVLAKICEGYLSGNGQRGLLLPTHVLWALHNIQLGYWTGVAHEAAQFLSNSIRINVSMRSQITGIVEKVKDRSQVRRSGFGRA